MSSEFSDASLPRLRSALWVDAYMRRCRWAGAFASLSRLGDESAGAIFIEILHDNGVDLWAPAAGSDGRVFERVLAGVSGADIAERMEREARFDSDMWLVTVEDREGRSFLEDGEHV